MNSIELKEQEESLDLSSTAKANFDRYLLDDRLRRLHKPMVAASVATALTIAAFALEPVPFTSPTLEISSEYDSANRLEIWVEISASLPPKSSREVKFKIESRKKATFQTAFANELRDF